MKARVRGVNHLIQGEYPDNWPEIAKAVKERAGWRCERCSAPHNPAVGRTLTVHHLDGNKSNIEDWNLAALCQACHLTIQARVNMFQDFMFSHTDWMKPHVEGRNEAIARGEWPEVKKEPDAKHN